MNDYHGDHTDGISNNKKTNPDCIDADLFCEDEDLPCANNYLRILKEIFDTTDLVSSDPLTSIGQSFSSSTYDGLDGENSYARIFDIISKLRVLKDKASRTVIMAPENSRYLMNLISDITVAFARVDGFLPEYITMGKGGATCSPHALPMDLDIASAPFLESSNTVAPSAYNIMIKLRSGDKQQTGDAVQAMLDICCGDSSVKDLDDTSGRINSRELRSVGGIQLLLKALMRSRKEEFDLEFQITKAISMLVTFEDCLKFEDTQMLLRNASEILNTLLGSMNTISDRKTQARSRANSTTTISSTDFFEKGWRTDDLGKAALSRQNSVESNNSGSSNEAIKPDDGELRFLVARALARLSEVLSQEWKKMDQAIPILPPASLDAGSAYIGRSSVISSVSLVRTDSAESVPNRPQSAGGGSNVRRRSLSGVGAGKDATTADPNLCLKLIVKIMTMICDDGSSFDGSRSSAMAESSDVFKFSPLESPTPSPRGHENDPYSNQSQKFGFRSGSGNGFSGLPRLDKVANEAALVLCCKALCSLAEVPICVPALVEGGRALDLLKGLMQKCTTTLQTHLLNTTLNASLEENQASCLAGFVSLAIVNMLGSTDMPNNDRGQGVGRGPLLGWMDQQILRAGLANSIVILIRYTLDDFQLPDCASVRSTLPKSAERSLAHILHQLCSRHAYQRQQMLEMNTPYAFASLFVSAASRCQREDVPDSDYLEYMAHICLDGLTYFLTDFVGEQSSERSENNTPNLIKQLSCKVFIESITYTLSTLPQHCARLACLHVVSNLTEWPISLQALVEGRVVEPLVVIAQEHMRMGGVRIPSVRPFSGANYTSSSSTGNISNAMNITNVRQALSSYSLANVTSLAEYAWTDRGSSGGQYDGDAAARAAKASALGPHSILLDGDNPSRKIKGVFVNAAGVTEESMTVCSSLANIAQSSLEYAARLYKNGLLGIMLKIAENDNPEVKRQALRCVGAICPIIPSRASSAFIGADSDAVISRPRDIFIWNESHLHLEAARIRRNVSSAIFDVNSTLATETLAALSEALSSDNYMVQKEAIYGLAGLALSEDEAIKDQIFEGPLRLVCALMMDTNNEEELRTMAETVLINSGFKGGKDDFQICSHDFSRLQDWFHIRRWMEPQRLSYKLLSRWNLQLFPYPDSGASKPRDTNNWANNIGSVSPSSSKGSMTPPPVALSQTRSLSPVGFEGLSGARDGSTKVPLPGETTPSAAIHKSLAESIADMVGFNRKTNVLVDDEASKVGATPWNLGPANYYAKPLVSQFRNDAHTEGLDMPPSGATALQNLFFPSRIHKLFLLDFLTLGCEEESVNRSDFKHGYDSDSSGGSGSSSVRSRRARSTGRGAYFLPHVHEVYALGLPELHYHQITITSLARVLERTIFDCSAQAPDRLYALAFANSSFSEDFHETFLACLHKLPQISGLTFQENKTQNASYAFASSPRTNDNSLQYLGSHVPSTIRFLTFQGCLSGKQVQYLCRQLKRVNAAFIGHAENLHGMHDGDGYDSDASTHSYSTFHSGKDASSHIDRSRNGRDTGAQSRWKYTKGIIGLALTNIPCGNDEVKEISRLLNTKGTGFQDRASYSANELTKLDSSAGGAYPSDEDGSDSADANTGNDGRGLKYLDLSDNRMSDQHCSVLLDAASAGPLEGLELGGNSLKMCSSFLDSFKRMTEREDSISNSLRYLGLQNTALPLKGFCTLLEFLSQNKTLTSIDVSSNNFGTSAELEGPLVKLLESNNTLRVLDVSQNGLDADVVGWLEFGMMSNTTLLLLPFTGNVENRCFKELRKSLARNRHLYSKAVRDKKATQKEKSHINRQKEPGHFKRLGTFEEVSPIDIRSLKPHTMQLTVPSESEEDASSPVTRSPISPTSSLKEASEQSIVSDPPIKTPVRRIEPVTKKQGLPIDEQRTLVSQIHQHALSESSYGRTNMRAKKYNMLGNSQIVKRIDTEIAITEKNSVESVIPPESPRSANVEELDEKVSSPKISRSSSMHLASTTSNTLFVFFAAPLALRERGGSLLPAGLPLPYNVERDAIMQVFKEVQRDNNVSFGFATTDAVRSAVTMGCRALHISGHGHQSAVWFEDGLAGLQLVDKESLIKLLRAGNAPTPDFVFISACYSESTAEAFLDLGVKHVVCVKVDVQIQDSLAVVFTRAFYLALLSGQHTVKNAFDIGIQALSTSPYVRGGAKGAELESSKFILLPKTSSHDDYLFSRRPLKKWPSKPHHCAFTGSATADMSNTSFSMSSPGSKYVLAPPVDFVGREVDTYRVIRDISKQRLVTLVGVPGVGKTSLACAACTYMADRRLSFLEDGVVFLKAKGVTTYPAFLRAMNQMLVDRNTNSIFRARMRKLQHNEDDSDDDQGVNSSNSQKNSGKHTGKVINAEDDVSRLEKLILSFFVPLRALLVLDHIDDMFDMEDLKVFLASLFQDCAAVKVLVVCTQTLRMLRIPTHGVAETTCGIDNLTLKNTLRLFARMSPLLKTIQDKESFVRKMLGDRQQAQQQQSMTMASRGITTKSANILRALGNGHPATILKLAHECTGGFFEDLLRLTDVGNISS